MLYTFIPQFLVWQILYNTFWKSPYISTLEGFSITSPHILGVLFSPESGIFLVTPIVLIGCIGLLLKQKPTIPSRYMAGAFIAQVFLISTWSVWWQGASYSGRMFVSLLPYIAFGIAHILHRLYQLSFNRSYTRLGILIPLSFINIMLILCFLLQH